MVLREEQEEQRAGQLHHGCQQPHGPTQPFCRWKGTKAAPAAPPHPPRTCTASLPRAHVRFVHHCQLFFFLCPKMPLAHSFPPPFPLPHLLPNLSQHLSSLLPLPNPSSCYSSCLPCHSLLPLLPTALPSKCPDTETTEKSHGDIYNHLFTLVPQG